MSSSGLQGCVHFVKIHLGVYSYFLCMCVIVCYSLKMSIYLNVKKREKSCKKTWETSCSLSEEDLSYPEAAKEE